jgi:hypothetical protein
MSEVRTPPVKATLVNNIDEVLKTPGAFEYTRAGKDGPYPGGMLYACPCGCGHMGSLMFRPVPDGFPGHPSWEWDGNMEAPTLSPSVHHVGHWHGFLRNGVWESC